MARLVDEATSPILRPTMQEHQIHTRENSGIKALQAGERPLLLLLHGVLRNADDFAEIVSELETRWRVILPSFRGHGLSSPSNGNYRVVDYVEDVLATFEQLTDGPAVILGHSLGAMVAAAVAAAVPSRVRAIVLEDPPLETMGSRISQAGLLEYFQQIHALLARSLSPHELADALADVRVIDPMSKGVTRLGKLRDTEALQLFAKCLCQVDPQVLVPIVTGAWLDEFNVEDVFRRIECPVLLLQGNESLGGMLTDIDADSISRWCGHCTRVKIENAGHHLHTMQPDLILRHIQEFADSLPAGRVHDIPAPHLRNHSHEDSSRHHDHSQRATG